MTTYQLFDALPAHIEDALRASIERFGVLVPVVRDQHGTTIDGHHRARIADQLGVKYRIDVVTVAGEDEAREIAQHLNSRRRHLSGEQLREHIVMLAQRTTPSGVGELSQNEIAQVAGVSQQYVGQVLGDPQVTSTSTLPDSRRGADGKVYPSKRPTVVAAKNEKEAERAQQALTSLGDTAGGGRVYDVTQLERERKEAERERKRDENRQLVEAGSPLNLVPEQKYSAIVFDPPWSWEDEGDVSQLGRARPNYHTMTFDEIAALPIGDYAEPNAHIYLWITNRSLPKGQALLDSWGFRYITALTWCKPHFGMGNYFRGSTEHVLFGVKGSLPLLRKDVGTWFEGARGDGHSAKPETFYQLVERCSPGPWVDILGRRERPGWATVKAIEAGV